MRESAPPKAPTVPQTGPKVLICSLNKYIIRLFLNEPIGKIVAQLQHSLPEQIFKLARENHGSI